MVKRRHQQQQNSNMLGVSIVVCAIATMIAMPLGAILAVWQFPGRSILVVIVNSLMGMPPVVVGLAVYMLLSRAGPLGPLGLLYTPSAMIVAQTILVTPIITALTHQVIRELHFEYDELLRSMGANRLATIATLLWDARYSLITAILAGFGRASAEVGAVMIVGGNIDHVTRMMTTAIALETSRGDLSMAMALGLILIAIPSLQIVRITPGFRVAQTSRLRPGEFANEPCMIFVG